MEDKASKRALEAYPVKEEWVGNQYGGTEDVNKLSREKYTEGYHQAEKDLALTIEDVKKIHAFLYAVKNNKQGVFTFTRLSDEQYQEVLNQFNKKKEK